MKAIIIKYKTDERGQTQYNEDRKPLTEQVVMKFPLSFKYGSYNEPKKVIAIDGSSFNVDDIISINVLPTNTSDEPIN